MAQTGFTPISIYYSSTASNVPTAGNLVAGELAINTADGRLYYKDSGGAVQVIGTKGGVGTSTTTQVLYNSSGLVIGSANMTFNGTALTLANDASISGLTVGKGGGAVASATAFGYQALNATNTGGNNTGIGYQAGFANTSGTDNTSTGWGAGALTTTGSNNASLGAGALFQNTTGATNTAIGSRALYNNTTASNNTAVGYQALLNSTGGYNTALGTGAGSGVTTGAAAIHIGYNAGSSATTGNYNVYIGNSATASSAGVSSETVLGGNAATGKGANTAFIAGSSGSYQGNNSATWSITSDQRLKKNIVDNTTGLSAITAIQVRNFEYRLPEEITEVSKDQAIQKTGIQLGAIAQELQAVLPDCVKTESTGVMSVDTTNITWHLINAVKELNAKITALENK